MVAEEWSKVVYSTIFLCKCYDCNIYKEFSVLGRRLSYMGRGG